MKILRKLKSKSKNKPGNPNIGTKIIEVKIEHYRDGKLLKKIIKKPK